MSHIGDLAYIDLRILSESRMMQDFPGSPVVLKVHTVAVRVITSAIDEVVRILEK